MKRPRRRVEASWLVLFLALFRFRQDQVGRDKVDRITMKAVSPLADFSFGYQDVPFRLAEATT